MVGTGCGGKPASKLENGKAAKVDETTPGDNAISVFAVKKFDQDIGNDIGNREKKEATIKDNRANLPDFDGTDVRHTHSAAED